MNAMKKTTAVRTDVVAAALQAYKDMFGPEHADWRVEAKFLDIAETMSDAERVELERQQGEWLDERDALLRKA